MKPDNPMQPIILDNTGVARFKENTIVHFLYQWSRSRGMGLNEMYMMPFPVEDWEQFLQLIGFSVSGFGELVGGGCIRPETVAKADDIAEELKPHGKPSPKEGPK